MLFLIDVVDCYRKWHGAYYCSFNYGSLNPLQKKYIYSLEAITISDFKLFLQKLCICTIFGLHI